MVGYVQAGVKNRVTILEEAVKKLSQSQEDNESELEETQIKLEDLLKDREVCGLLTRAKVVSSRLSSVLTNNTADKATDGRSDTEAATETENYPWYSAELGVRFSRIQLSMRLFQFTERQQDEHHFDPMDSSFTVYTVDEGVKTRCRDRETSCHTAGTGFKIVHTHNNTQLHVEEVTTCIKLA